MEDTHQVVLIRHSDIRDSNLIRHSSFVIRHSPSVPDPGPRALWSALLVFALSLAMHLPFLAITPIAGTEGHRIFPAHEMVRSGWWTVPVLFGRPFLTKPPLHMWLIAASERLTGHGNVFVWRLPSALMGAALCAVVCWFGARWFGRIAGLISGLCCTGMITLWGQSQVADIDATNTLAAAVASMCGIELLIVGTRSRAWLWIMGAGLALGATLMAKGPGGLPIVIGVWLWGMLMAVHNYKPGAQRSAAPDPSEAPGDPGLRCAPHPAWRQARITRQAPASMVVGAGLLPLLIGAGIFGTYSVVAQWSLRRHGLPLDWSGVEEGTSRVIATSFKSLGKSLLVIPTQLFAFAIPVSLATPVYFQRQVRRTMDDRTARIATALVAAVLIAWAVCVASGMDNPRYGYPTLPLLCPLAGAVAVAAARAEGLRKSLRVLVTFCAFAYAMAAVVLSFSTWRLSHAPSLLPVLVGSTALAMAAALWIAGRLRVSWNATWAFVPLIFFTAIPFGIQRYVDRSATSGIHAAQKLREIVGKGSIVAVGGDVTSKPETFYYADVRVNFFPGQFVPEQVSPGTWVVLDQQEHNRWLRKAGARLEKDVWLCRNGKTDYYVAWYVGTGK